MFEYIENAMCEEMDRLDDEYKKGKELTSGDLAKAEQIGRTLKNLASYTAMKEAMEGASERSYGSYARSRYGSGRYMSRDGGSMRGRSRGPRDEIDPYWESR